MSESSLDMCRICLVLPEPQYLPFVHIMTPIDGELKFKNLIRNFLGINIGSNDGKPDKICKFCVIALEVWDKMSVKASDYRNVLNYMSSKQRLPGKSFASTSSLMLRHNGESSQESTFETSRIPSNQFFNDDCIDKTAPIELIELISDDEGGEYDIEERIEISSDKKDNDDLTNKYFNNVTEKLYYCSICQKKNILGHDCSQHTKSFFTCLVPHCNILSRSKKDFTFHYQLHNGMSTSENMCDRCFKVKHQSNIDGNGRHIHCDTVNLFRCYSCNARFNGMQEFAFHKLKTHNGILMDVECNFLCLYCEKSYPDILEITEHIKHCLENQAKNVTATSMKLKKPTKKKAELLPVKINNKKNVMIRTNRNVKKIPCTSQHVLFTCLKPSCNEIFTSFSNFKHHYRCHFELGSALVCWQCCKPFSDAHDLRVHQVRNNCRTPGMYKCFKCSLKFDDVESLSIHKLTFHDGKLMASQRNKKTIRCEFCKMYINIFDYKSHLVTCNKKDDQNNKYPCLICKKVFRSRVSLSNHLRVHNPPRINSNVMKE